jgi:hypothetical protein
MNDNTSWVCICSSHAKAMALMDFIVQQWASGCFEMNIQEFMLT